MIYKLKGSHIRCIIKRYTGINNPKLIARRQPIEPVVMGITGIRIALKKIKSPLRIALAHILCTFSQHISNHTNALRHMTASLDYLIHLRVLVMDSSFPEAQLLPNGPNLPAPRVYVAPQTYLRHGADGLVKAILSPNVVTILCMSPCEPYPSQLIF